MTRVLAKTGAATPSNAKVRSRKLAAAPKRAVKAQAPTDMEMVGLSLEALMMQAERGDMKIHTLPKEAGTKDAILAFLKSA